MIPSEARAELLAQHERLRELMAAAVAMAARLVAGELVEGDFQARLVDLRDAFAAHNASEEALLEPMLDATGAWGPLRVARMLEEHSAEHAAFRALLSGPSREVAARLADLAEDLDAHMAAEERTFLSPSVLSDRGGRR